MNPKPIIFLERTNAIIADIARLVDDMRIHEGAKQAELTIQLMNVNGIHMPAIAFRCAGRDPMAGTTLDKELNDIMATKGMKFVVKERSDGKEKAQQLGDTLPDAQRPGPEGPEEKHL